MRASHPKSHSAVVFQRECLLIPLEPGMAASMHLPVWEIVACRDEHALVYGMQQLHAM